MIGTPMSSFKRKESVSAASRRLVCAQLESAIQALSRDTKRDNASEADRAIAGARAALELAGPALPRDIVRRDRKRLDAIAKTLGQARLCRRLGNRLDKLIKRAGLDTDDAALKQLRKQIAQHTEGNVALRTRGQRFDPMVYRLVAELAELRGHVGHWPDAKADTPEAPPPGLAAVYRAARNAARKADDEAADITAAHRPIARLGESLTLISKCCPAMLKPQRAMLEASAKPLAALALDARLITSAGQDKSLADLAATLADAAQLDHADAASKLADARHYALAETPQAFTNRVGAYWIAWRMAS
ncbi:CHAD domain-containing protein [Phycisphaeraceae bacterium D3-23]